MNRILVALVITFLYQTARSAELSSSASKPAHLEPELSKGSILGGSFIQLKPGSKCAIEKGGQDPCPDPYYCIEGVCVHKNILPNIRPREIFGSVLVSIIIGLANAGGVGGSSFVIPVFIFFFQYTANEAVRVVYAVVLGGLLSGVALKVVLKEQKYKRPVIIYDIVVICAPLLVLGAKFGILANTIMPELLTVCLVWIVATVVLKSMWRNIKKSLEQDRKARAMAEDSSDQDMKKSLLDAPSSFEIEDTSNIQQESTPGYQSKIQYSTVAPEFKDHTDTNINASLESKRNTNRSSSSNVKLRDLLIKERRMFPWEYYLQFTTYLMLSFLLQAFNGSKKSHSIVSIQYCSLEYWLVYSMNIFLCLIFWGFGVLIVKHNEKARVSVGMDLPDEYKVNSDNIKKLSLISLGTGFLGGAIGLGGALLFVPVLLTFGIPPIRATSTASFMAIFTSATSVFVTVAGKQVSYIDALFLAGIAFLGATVIANPIVYLTKKYKRTSILTIILFCLLFIDLIYYPAYEIWRFVVARDETLAFSPLC